MKHHHTRKGRPQGAPSHKRAAKRRESAVAEVPVVVERHPNRRRKLDAAPVAAGQAPVKPERQNQPRLKPLEMTERHRWHGRPLRMCANSDQPAMASAIPSWMMGCDLHEGELSQVNVAGLDVPVLARARADVDGLDLVEVLVLSDRETGTAVCVVDAAGGLGVAGVIATCAQPDEGRFVDAGLLATLALARYVTRALERLATTISGPRRTLAAVYMEAPK